MNLLKRLLISSFLISSVSIAEEVDRNLYVRSVPAVCGDIEAVTEYVTSKELTPLNISFGKEGGQEEGKIVYIVTYYVNEEASESLASVNVPDVSETCILFHTFDMIHNTEELKGEKILWK